MGRRNRERIKRIINGSELPRSNQKDDVTPERWLTCKKCHHVVKESRAREHIRECWHYNIKDDEPIPNTPIIKQ